MMYRETGTFKWAVKGLPSAPSLPPFPPPSLPRSLAPSLALILALIFGLYSPGCKNMTLNAWQVLSTHVGDVVLVSDAASHVIRPLFVGDEREPDLHRVPATCGA